MKHSKMIAAKRIAVAVAAVCATMSAPAFAADAKSLLDLMLKKGVITQAEYDEYMKSDAYENQQFKDQRIDQDVSKSVKFMQKREKDGAVKGSGLGLVSEDGKNEINLTGRLHFDYRSFSDGFKDGAEEQTYTQKSGNQFDIRRARIGFNGKFMGDFSYEMVWNAAASDSSNIDTAWLNYGAVKEAQLRVGRFKQQFNLEDVGTSSNNIDFIERSYVNQVNPGKKLGLMLHGVPVDGTSYGVSVFQENNSTTSGTAPLQASARVTANIAKLASVPDSVIHLGLSSVRGSYDVASSSSTRSDVSNLTIRSESRGVEGFKLTNQDTRYYATVVERNLMGMEVAYATGPVKLQSEWVDARFTNTDRGNDTVEAQTKAKIYYVAATYNVTGEKWSEAYRDGSFSSVKPLSNFKPGAGIGAIQIGVRYSAYDVEVITGTNSGSPKGSTATLGLTWILNPNTRLMLNHSVTKFDTPFSVGGNAPTADTERATVLRGQYNF